MVGTIFSLLVTTLVKISVSATAYHFKVYSTRVLVCLRMFSTHVPISNRVRPTCGRRSRRGYTLVRPPQQVSAMRSAEARDGRRREPSDQTAVQRPRSSAGRLRHIAVVRTNRAVGETAMSSC